MSNKIKKIWSKFGWIILIVIFFSPFFAYGYRIFVIEKEKNIVYSEYVSLKIDDSGTTPQPKESNTPEKQLPDSITIYVPFTTQAPKANWDATHEETCEEASLIMVKHQREKADFDSKDAADKEILDLVSWENTNNYKVDVTVTELKTIANLYYSMSTGRIKKNPSIDDIKRELASGRPVIIPAAGKLLNNPNFQGGGPVYHMLVLKGYDKNGFIANDPGTRNGEGYRYSFDTLYNAIHDWNPTDILKGEKAYLVFD